MSILRAFFGFVAVLVLCGVTASVAAAHAEPERAIPPINGEIEVGPSTIEIWFSEEVTEDTTIKVTNASGDQVDTGTTTLDLQDPNRQHVLVPLKSALPQGEYTVAWSSVSGEDGDPDSGTFTFTVLTGTPVASPAAASSVASPQGTPSAASTEIVNGAKPTENIDTHALAIALAVGCLAGLLIFGFWQWVKPRGDEIYVFDDESTSDK